MKPVICLDPLYPDLAAQQKIARIAQAGFEYVEFWAWRDKNIPALLEASQQHGVKIANFSGHRVGSLIAAEAHALLLQDLSDAVVIAQRLQCSTLMLLTNALNQDGSVSETFDQIPAPKKFEHTVAGLRKAVAVTPAEINLVLEPLNTKIDHPGYYLTDMETASALVQTVADPRLKVLCDLYHLGVMGSDLEQTISQFLPVIGYFHVADFPGRHEPGTGSANWIALLRLIQQGGYTGYVGFEYIPETDSDKSLEAIQQVWQAL
jgi:hydroxypyruvate isomerase